MVEGVKQFIIRLANTGVRLAVASSAARPKIELVLTRFPAPDVFIQSALKLNTHPSVCIVIEDSTNGIVGAKRAGMLCIGFRNPKSGNQDLTGADCVIENFLETETITIHDGFLELK